MTPKKEASPLLPPEPADSPTYSLGNEGPRPVLLLAAGGLVLMISFLLLKGMGRGLWCSCGELTLWKPDVSTFHTSQHLFDPYSFTHLLHGFLLCGILWLLLAKRPWEVRLWLAVVLEAGWELLENSNFVIQRYRAATSSIGYAGDSLGNSLGDIICCFVGFLVARRLGFRRALVVFLAVEGALLLVIRDSLVLNIILLLHPFEALKAWQLSN